MQSLPGSESEQLEDHLLICPECQEHLRATDAYLAAMRGACLQDRGRETFITGQSLPDPLQWRGGQPRPRTIILHNSSGERKRFLWQLTTKLGSARPYGASRVFSVRQL